MTIQVPDGNRIVVELDAPEVEMVIERLPDGFMIAAWLDSQSGEPVRILAPGRSSQR